MLKRLQYLMLAASLFAAYLGFAHIIERPIHGILLCLIAGFSLYLYWRGLSRLADSVSADLKREVIEANAKYKQVVENLPVGLFFFERGRLTFTNWAWDEQFDRAPGQAATDCFHQMIHEDEREQVLSQFAEFERREEPFTMSFRVKSQMESMRHIEAHGVPVYGADGSFNYILGFNLDTSSAELAAFELDSKNKALASAYRDLEDNLEAMLASLVKAIEAKDPYTAGHSERVMEYSLRLGRAMGLSEEDMQVLRMGTLIHDIGKIGVPDEVLTKPDRLTAEEYEIIKKHPVTGFKMIRDIPYFKACAPIVRWHHERLDGKGYPDGLKGDEIPLLVQITTVADMFDAMTSNRAYRRSLGVDVALSELRKDAKDAALNPELVELWAKLLGEDGYVDHSEVVVLPRAA